MRYRCLILDHDDTAVDSTAVIHYPAHVRALGVLRPGLEPIGLEGWLLKNFDPGIMPYLRDELGMSEEELEAEYRIWRECNLQARAPFYPGFVELLRRFQEAGGRIAVVSHSEADLILEDYRRGDSGTTVLPELIFGWDPEEERRKPSPWPVLEVLRRFSLQPGEVLVVDDLKPGLAMARAAGVAIAAAGWGHRIEPIRAYMQANCQAYLESVGDLATLLFES
ncbi:MAG: HAD family hydrolase [Spirochaetales bacterium]|nr:HAD family hydrolase [Spirochaetales bacterium]